MRKNNGTEDVYFIGVDGGGTHCRARLTASDGNVLGEAVGGSANTTRGSHEAMQEVIKTCSMAIASAGLADAIYKQTFVGAGLAGLTVADEKSRYTCEDHPFAGLTSESDAYAACLGAHHGNDGGIVIAGTGSAAFAIANGNAHSIGGWGFLLGDDGSGARLGLNVLRQSIKVHDGMLPGSAMADDILSSFDNDIQKVFAWARSATPKDFGAFAPKAFDWAEKGDALAEELVSQTVVAISQHFNAIINLGVSRICLFGGMSSRLRPLLDETIRQIITEPMGDAQDGALLMAKSMYDAEHGGNR